MEAEFGTRLTKTFEVDDGYGNVYVKPILVQTFNDGDEVKSDFGLRKMDVLKKSNIGTFRSRRPLWFLLITSQHTAGPTIPSAVITGHHP